MSAGGAAGFARPRLGLSRCLELEACRYDGARIPSALVRKLAPHVELVSVCPEVAIGLGVPRDTLRLVRGGGGEVRLVQPATGADLSQRMDAFAQGWLDQAPPLDGFILKYRSPSCGPGDVRVYAGTDRSPVVGKAPGLFAAALLARRPDLAVEDEGRLENARIRDHFLTRLFAMAALRALADAPTMARLVAFHARYKLLLLVHHQALMRELGRVVANPRGQAVEAVCTEYAEGFARAMARPARRVAHVNALQHALGHFKDSLQPAERARFIELVDAFVARRVPLAAPLAVVRSWCARDEHPWLDGQAWFEPYPQALVEMRDSGKGLEY
ncbi:MAG: DUF1722 domain-containing protein [Deltaproteobacteria bacterium]|nr:DUF1722 domain-containing protein [Deltaproteobacteria bacterium]